MDPITPGNRSREAEPESQGAPGGRGTRPGSQAVPPEVYWRRRVFALAAGLAVLGLLAWAVGGASANHPVADTTSYNNQSQQPAQPSGPTGYPSPATSSASPSPSPSPSSSGHSPSPSPSPSASGSKAAHQQGKKPKTAAKQHGARRPLAAGVNAPGDDCPPGDVVVSLAASGNTFGADARPHFTITVVSTAGRACQANVGPRYLTLVIESGGVREWGSGDCVKGGGTQVKMLARGVPVQRRLTWNRTLSSPGCRLPASTARPGTYTATASDAGAHSHTVVFLLH
jgi:hypothetical protein